MGLDPATRATLSSLLKRLADNHSPRLAIALRPQDPVPEWITHVVTLKSLRVEAQGEKHAVLGKATEEAQNQLEGISLALSSKSPPIPSSKDDEQESAPRVFHKSQIIQQPDQVVLHMNQRELLIRMNGVRLSYGDKTVLGGWKQYVEGEERGGLWWQVARGDRWGIFGENGKKGTSTSNHHTWY